MAGGALESRPAGTCRGHEKCAPGHRPWDGSGDSPWSTELGGTLFPSRMATISLGVLVMMCAMLSITGIFGMAAYSVSKRLKELGIRVALGAQRKEVLQAALGRAFKLLAIGSGVGLVLGLLATKVLAFIVYQATRRDPLVLTGTVLAMALLGLIATWIPAQRALSVDPAILVREEWLSLVKELIVGWAWLLIGPCTRRSEIDHCCFTDAFLMI